MRLSNTSLLVAIFAHIILLGYLWEKLLIVTSPPPPSAPITIWRQQETPFPQTSPPPKPTKDNFRQLDQTPRPTPEETPFSSDQALASDAYRKGEKTLDLSRLAPTRPNQAAQKPQNQEGDLATADRFAAFGGLYNRDGQLNYETVRTAYYAYWRRLEQRIAPPWQAKIRNYLQGRSGIRLGTYMTTISFQVGPSGEFTLINIESSSGIPALDDLAATSIQGASPTPNPPADMINSELNLLKIRFIVQVTDQQGIQFQRIENANDPF